MKILCVHGWLRSNLGDQLMAHSVLKMLREEGHEIVVESCGFPQDGSFDTYVTISREPQNWSTEDRCKLFVKFDRIVNLPGGGLQAADFRMTYIERDIKIARQLEVPYALSSHSICELVDVNSLRQVSLIIAREQVTVEFLTKRGVPCIDSADFAWMTVIPPVPKQNESLLMLRWDGRIPLDSILLNEDTLQIDKQVIRLHGPLTVSTSDHMRDSKLGRCLAERLKCEWKPCLNVDELLLQISGAQLLITDRYHPAIVAKMANVECYFVGGPGVRNDGLRAFSETPSSDLRARAILGLEALRLWCREDSPNSFH